MKEIPLTQGKVALVDDEDFDRVNQFKWYAMRFGGTGYYGARNIVRPDGVKRPEYLHNFILGFKGVDHLDGDGLNDQKSNLRRATHRQNLQAFRRKAPGKSSLFRGVAWDSSQEKWRVQLESGRKKFHLGRFSDETEAARAYDKAAREHFGEFAAPNFP